MSDFKANMSAGTFEEFFKLVFGGLTEEEAREILTKHFYVYALKADDGTVKIGMSNSPGQRKATVERENLLEVTEIHQVELPTRRKAFEAEKELHKLFADRRTHDEFFNITFEEACAALDKYQGQPVEGFNPEKGKALWGFWKSYFGDEQPEPPAQQTLFTEEDLKVEKTPSQTRLDMLMELVRLTEDPKLRDILIREAASLILGKKI